MPKFTVYDTITGEILRSGSASTESLANKQARPDRLEAVLVSEAINDLDFRVDTTTKRRVPDSTGRDIRDANAAAEVGRRAALAARLNSILQNPTTDQAVKTLAEIELERL